MPLSKADQLVELGGIATLAAAGAAKASHPADGGASCGAAAVSASGSSRMLNNWWLTWLGAVLSCACDEAVLQNTVQCLHKHVIEAKQTELAIWRGRTDCIPGCTMVNAIWIIADKMIWVNLGSIIKNQVVCWVSAKEKHVGRQIEHHLQFDITQKTSH